MEGRWTSIGQRSVFSAYCLRTKKGKSMTRSVRRDGGNYNRFKSHHHKTIRHLMALSGGSLDIKNLEEVADKCQIRFHFPVYPRDIKKVLGDKSSLKPRFVQRRMTRSR